MKTIVAPLSSVTYIDFEYIKTELEEKEEMRIHYNSNSCDTVVEKNGDIQLCLRIFDDTDTHCKDAKYESSTIKDFEKDWIDANLKLLQLQFNSDIPTAFQ